MNTENKFKVVNKRVPPVKDGDLFEDMYIGNNSLFGSKGNDNEKSFISS